MVLKNKERNAIIPLVIQLTEVELTTWSIMVRVDRLGVCLDE